MPNGKPGDHPRTDLLIHNIEVYGNKIDDVLRSLLKLMPAYEFDEWFNPYWQASKEELLQAASKKLEEKREEASQRGWDDTGAL